MEAAAAMSGHPTTRCVCGKTEVVAVGAVTLTKIRCPECPPEHPKPQLRLVK